MEDENTTHDVGELMKMLGGLDNVINHCLNDDTYCKQNIDIENVEILKKIASTQKENDDNNVAISNQDINQNNSQTLQSTQSQQQQTKTIQMNINQFRDSRTIIAVDSTNNSYFYIFSLNIALHIYYNFIHSKKFPIIFTVSITFCYILSKIFEAYDIDVMFFISWWAVHILPAILGILLSLSMNIDIMKLTLKTFDFWYKVCGGVQMAVGLFVVFIPRNLEVDNFSYTDTIITRILVTVFLVCCMLPVFMSDALYLHPIIKLVMHLAVVGVAIYSAISQYFYFSDVTWNPFPDNKHTDISFKNLTINGEITIAFYTLKPLISMVKNNIMKKDKYGNDKIRSAYITNKPYFKWNNSAMPMMESVRIDSLRQASIAMIDVDKH